MARRPLPLLVLWFTYPPHPQLYEYTVSIADEGREGTFMALGNVPTFVATLLAGGMSGYLLSTYCPPNPPRHSVRASLLPHLPTASSPPL